MSDLGWHWVAGTLRDSSPIPADGEWLEHEGEVEMCMSGLHASRRVLDALRYAPGSTCCRVEVGEIVEEDTDKLVCRRRRILWRVEDCDELLRDFARRCALEVIDQWDAPPIVREYLETGREELRAAARDAAWDAARDAAAWDAAWDAAAWDAAWAAARAVARDAAWAVARDAAWAAVWDAAKARQNRRLTSMISSARKGLTS